MWVPYQALGPLRIEGDREAAEASQRDNSPRPFLVAFFVESPGARDIETDFALGEERNLDLVDPRGCRRPVRLAAGRTGRLAELLVPVEERGAERALAAAWRLAATTCARWSATSGRAVAIAGWRIADLHHRAAWHVAPFRPSTVPLPPTPELPLLPEHFTLLRAYEEARRSRSTLVRLVLSYRIVSAFATKKEPFVTTDRLAATSGVERRVPVLRRLDLVLADCRRLFDEPVPSEISWETALSELATQARRVHEFLDPDRPTGDGSCWYELETECDIAAAANLADLLAHRILCEEMRLLGELARRAEGAPTGEGIRRVDAPA